MSKEFSDERIGELLKSSIQIDDSWLLSQRNKLIGAIDQAEQKNWKWRLQNLSDQFYTLFSIPRLATGAALLVFGMWMGYSLPNSIHDSNSEGLMDLLANGSIQSIQLAQHPQNSDQLHFKLIAAQEMEYSGTTNDQDAVQLLYHMLTNTPNSGERLNLVQSLDEFNLEDDLSLTALVKVLLDEQNLAIQLSLFDKISEVHHPLVRDALVRIALGEYPDALRLLAVKSLQKFNNDEYTQDLLNVIAATDANPSIRYSADQSLLPISGERSLAR